MEDTKKLEMELLTLVNDFRKRYSSKLANLLMEPILATTAKEWVDIARSSVEILDKVDVSRQFIYEIYAQIYELKNAVNPEKFPDHALSYALRMIFDE